MLTPVGNPGSTTEEPFGHSVARLKIQAPASRRGHVVRERLLARLDEATSRRCTLVVAGPGYGKSLEVSAWALRQERFSRVAWLSLDALDVDPQRLCSGLLLSLRTALTHCGTDARQLLSLRPVPVPPYLTFVSDALVPALEQVDEPILLVIDDVQYLASSPSATAILDTLLRWAPPQLHLVLIGRADPPVSLQRLRLSDDLSVLRQKDLACTPDESAALLRSAGVELATADSQKLHELTQGWPAALQLAALSLVELGTVPALFERFLERDVALADYLTSEVLAGLPDQLSEFVLRATVDDLVCGSLLDEVLGSGGSSAMLADCEHRNLFLTPVSDEGEQWYGWHHMFAGQMRRRLALTDPTAAREGHLRAAGWWRDRDPALAARHAIGAGRPELAAQIVEGSWLDLALKGESSTLHELIAMLPKATRRSAGLHLANSYAHLLESRPAAAAEELQSALIRAAELPEPERWRFDALAAWLRLLLVDRYTELSEVVAEAQRVVDGVAAEPARQSTPEHALALLALGMGHARLQVDAATAIRQLRAAARVGRNAGLDILEFAARAETCMPLLATDSVAKVEREATELVEEAHRRGWDSFSPVSVPTGVLAWLAYWRGDVEAAERGLERVRQIAPRGDWSLLGLGAYFHGRNSLYLGDHAAADTHLAEALELAESGCLPTHSKSLIAGLRAEILAARGDLPGALASLPDDGQPEYRMTTFTRVDLLRRLGRPSESFDVLDAMPQQEPYPHIEVMKRVLRALALADLGDREAAHLELESALASAEPDRLLQPFLYDAQSLRPLIEAHIRHGTVHEAFATLVAARVAAPVTQASGGRHAQLTERELDILRYLRTSMPNAEIAAALFVSVNTVKTHAASIYRKLGVTGRRQAVHRAEELGLYAPGGQVIPRG